MSYGRCDDCDHPLSETDLARVAELPHRHEDDPTYCQRCQEARDDAESERAEARRFAAYHGGDTPQTLAEQTAAAWNLKREG